MNPIWYEILDRDPLLYIPIILVLTVVFYHLLCPVYTGTIYKRGDNKSKPQWNQIVDGENDPKKAEGIY